MLLLYFPSATQVRKVIPVEQGLRQQMIFNLMTHNAGNVRKVIPVEQGLRLFDRSHVLIRLTVRKVIPVEQGLRLSFPCYYII